MDDWKKFYRDYALAVLLLVAGILIGKLPDNIGWGWTIAGLLFVPLIAIAVGNVGAKFLLDSWNHLLDKFIKWRTTPKIKHWFILSEKNDLRLRLHNPSQKKHVDIECQNRDFRTIRGKRYIHEFPNELGLVRGSLIGDFPLYRGTLTPNDTIEIEIGISHNGKIALKFLSDDSPVYGFRDGSFEYVIECNGRYSNSGRKYNVVTTFSGWLTIKDGVLIKVDEEL